MARPDWTKDKDSKKIDKWEDLEELSQGGLGMKVIDNNGNVKEEIRHVRVSGKGSIAAYKNNAQAPQWDIKRKDKIPGLSKK